MEAVGVDTRRINHTTLWALEPANAICRDGSALRVAVIAICGGVIASRSEVMGVRVNVNGVCATEITPRSHVIGACAAANGACVDGSRVWVNVIALCADVIGACVTVIGVCVAVITLCSDVIGLCVDVIPPHRPAQMLVFKSLTNLFYAMQTSSRCNLSRSPGFRNLILFWGEQAGCLHIVQVPGYTSFSPGVPGKPRKRSVDPRPRTRLNFTQCPQSPPR